MDAEAEVAVAGRMEGAWARKDVARACNHGHEWAAARHAMWTKPGTRDDKGRNKPHSSEPGAKVRLDATDNGVHSGIGDHVCGVLSEPRRKHVRHGVPTTLDLT